MSFRLDQLLEEVINSTSIRTNLEERDVDVAYLIDSPVPLGLQGDYVHLKNILMRLLTNSIKATIQGEIIIFVKLAKASPGNTFLHVNSNSNSNPYANRRSSTEFPRSERVYRSASVNTPYIGRPLLQSPRFGRTELKVHKPVASSQDALPPSPSFPPR